MGRPSSLTEMYEGDGVVVENPDLIFKFESRRNPDFGSAKTFEDVPK